MIKHNCHIIYSMCHEIPNVSDSFVVFHPNFVPMVGIYDAIDTAKHAIDNVSRAKLIRLHRSIGGEIITMEMLENE